VDTNEPDVRALLVKVATGELDAAITYATDVAADPAVDGIDVPHEFDVVASYPIAVLRAAPDPGAASAFVEFVTSAEGQSLLEAHGFRLP
jgi:molybdate transport system substrate-binding protein